MARQSKHAPAKVQCSLRQREAAELRAQKLTMQEIADKLGVTRPRVHQLLEAWDENYRTENVALAEQIRMEQLDELRLLKNQWFPRVAGGQADAKDLQAYLKMLSHEADLAGAKAATTVKTELTGKDGAPIATVDRTAETALADMPLEKLRALAELLDSTPPTP